VSWEWHCLAIVVAVIRATAGGFPKRNPESASPICVRPINEIESGKPAERSKSVLRVSCGWSRHWNDLPELTYKSVITQRTLRAAEAPVLCMSMPAVVVISGL
jgi:hypothetical protein